jgi:hypothetical protein
MSKKTNREAWLQAGAAELARRVFRPAGIALPAAALASASASAGRALTHAAAPMRFSSRR